MYNVLIELMHLNHNTGFVPFGRVVSNLVLYADQVSNLEWWQAFGMLRPSFLRFHMTNSKCFLSSVKGVLPSWVGFIPAREDRNEVLDWFPEHRYCR